MTSPKGAPAAQPESESSLGAACVRALLERAGLPRHRHSAHVAGLLELSYHQAHRRLLGTAPWTLEELQVVASHHNETLADLLRDQTPGDDEAAVLIAGPLRVTCRLWPGQPVTKPKAGELIAVKGGLEWVVMVAGDTPTPQAMTVRRLVIETQQDRPRRFAVLEHGIDPGQGLSVGLEELGFDATHFSGEKQLEAVLEAETFDAYIIDWMLGRKTAEALVAGIRAQHASVPIAVMTSTGGRAKVDETALVASIARHGLLYLHKPVTAAIAASQFRAAFHNR